MGRGCLAGPVFAAAVILNNGIDTKDIKDSKKISFNKRIELCEYIKQNSIYALGSATVEEIDKINILNASFLGMHRAIEKLSIVPELLLIDGNRFNAYKEIPHHCIIKGDGKYQSIAAASILAKTHRDEFMEKLHEKFPAYDWKNNKGYPTKKHKSSIMQNGISPYHRRSYNLNFQGNLF